MSHNQIQRYGRTMEVNGELRVYCNILRAYIPVYGKGRRVQFSESFHPPIDNGRNRPIHATLTGNGSR